MTKANLKKLIKQVLSESNVVDENPSGLMGAEVIDVITKSRDGKVHIRLKGNVNGKITLFDAVLV